MKACGSFWCTAVCGVVGVVRLLNKFGEVAHSSSAPLESIAYWKHPIRAIAINVTRASQSLTVLFSIIAIKAQVAQPLSTSKVSPLDLIPIPPPGLAFFSFSVNHPTRAVTVIGG
jgi:hypothetical protein